MTGALGASANAFKNLRLLGFRLCILAQRCLYNWKIGVLSFYMEIKDKISPVAKVSSSRQ